MTFPTESLEPLRYTVENGNGSKATVERDGQMEVEDLEGDEPSLKRVHTPPDDDGPPAKRSLTEEEDEEEVKGDSEAVDGEGDVESCDDQVTEADVCDMDELLPKSMPKVYDLFATCVSS